MLGFSILGLVSCLLMREVPMQVSLDPTWGLKPEEKEAEKELAGPEEAHHEKESL